MYCCWAILAVLAVSLISVESKTGDATHYDLGLTACGSVHSDSEFVAAIARNYWTAANPNKDPICGKRATVVNPKNGKRVTVTIYDKCMGCQPNDIDLSPAAFSAIEPLGTGRFTVNWDFS